MHFLGSYTTVLPSATMAPKGQASAHFPQDVQASGFLKKVISYFRFQTVKASISKEEII